MKRLFHVTFLASMSLALGGSVPGAAVDDAIAPAPIRFAPCPENPDLECGVLDVPVDYGRPNGPKLGMAVIRARATKPAQRIGILVSNPGGPGISGVDQLLFALFFRVPSIERLRERFDLVSFDPRGVGRSRAVACNGDSGPIPANRTDEEAAAFYDRFGRSFVEDCAAAGGSLVFHLGTKNVARDMDRLRMALGEKELSFAGFSYGTVVGSTYVSMFPQRVRAMLLDGAVPPHYRDSFQEFWMWFSQALEMSLQHVDRVCRKDPACALSGTGVVAAFDEIAGTLDAVAVTTASGRRFTREDFATVVGGLTDEESDYPLLVSLLAEARSGDLQPLIDQLPRAALLFDEEPSPFFPHVCTDYGTRRRTEDVLAMDDAVGVLHPRFFGRFFLAKALAPCSAWPVVDPPVVRNVSREVKNPLMIVGNEFDNRTPMRSARDLAAALGMERHVLRYEGGGHTAFARIVTTACITDAVERYFVDLKAPGTGASCPALPVDFAPSARSTEARSSTPGMVRRVDAPARN